MTDPNDTFKYITKREFFAALITSGFESANFDSEYQNIASKQEVVEYAVETADILIAQLNKK